MAARGAIKRHYTGMLGNVLWWQVVPLQYVVFTELLALIDPSCVIECSPFSIWSILQFEYLCSIAAFPRWSTGTHIRCWVDFTLWVQQASIIQRTPETRDRPHDDVIKWKHFPRYWPFVRGIHRSGEFPAQRPVTRSFGVFFDLHLNKGLSKQSWGWWIETP